MPLLRLEQVRVENMTTEKSAGFRKFSEKVVLARTGKSTADWNSILDAWGMKEKGHTLSAKHLQQEYGVSPWWAQAVTIRYEWERGLRT